MYSRMLTAVALLLVFAPFSAQADSGFYIGASAGGATLEADIGDSGIPILPDSIDEDDTAFKVFAGYNFDLPSINLGVEAGYVDFGEPDIDTNVGELLFDPTGINLWGIAGIEALSFGVPVAAWESGGVSEWHQAGARVYYYHAKQLGF